MGRILRSRELYEERQRRKGVKAAGEEEINEREKGREREREREMDHKGDVK